MQMKHLTLLACIISTNSFACVDYETGVVYDLILSQSPGKTCMEVIANAHKFPSQREEEIKEVEEIYRDAAARTKEIDERIRLKCHETNGMLFC